MEADLGLMCPWATAEKRWPRAELRSQAERYVPEKYEEISRPTWSEARAWASLRAWKVQRCGWEGVRGVRQRRPSAKEKEHKEERSLERCAGIGRLQIMRFSFLGMLAEGEGHY